MLAKSAIQRYPREARREDETGKRYVEIGRLLLTLVLLFTLSSRNGDARTLFREWERAPKEGSFERT